MRRFSMALAIPLGAGFLAFADRSMAEAADPDHYEGARSCFKEQLGAGQPIMLCIERAAHECSQFPAGNAAGILCYVKAKDRWGEQIAAQMEKIKGEKDEREATIIGIELRYDLQANLLQCDRVEELALVDGAPDEMTAHSKAICESVAVGISYSRLLARSGELT